MRYCAACNPADQPLCRGRLCQGRERPGRVLPPGCCNITSGGRRRHCAKCCASARKNRAAALSPTYRYARVKRAAELTDQDASPAEIARALGIDVTTIRKYIREAGRNKAPRKQRK